MKHKNSYESSKYEVLMKKGNLFLECWNKGTIFLMSKMSNGMTYCLGEYWNLEDAKNALEEKLPVRHNFYSETEDENFGDECYVTEYYRGEYE